MVAQISPYDFAIRLPLQWEDVSSLPAPTATRARANKTNVMARQPPPRRHTHSKREKKYPFVPQFPPFTLLRMHPSGAAKQDGSTDMAPACATIDL